MSGYLQRLVSNARNPGTAIYPSLGSFFAGGTQETAAAPVVEDIVANYPPERFAARAPEIGLDRPSEEHDETPQNHRGLPIPLLPEKISSIGVAVDRTKVLPAGREHVAFARAKPTEGEGTEPVEMEQAKPAALHAAPVHESESREAAAAVFYKPLLAPGRALRNASSERDFRSERVVRTQQAPDEIQIHIGRIEISAVPPTPISRPQSRPAPKSLSLDDYLKGAKGR